MRARIIGKKFFYNLCKSGVISKDNVEVCTFGLQRLLIFLLNVFTYIIIGLVFDMPLESVIFILAYPPLRIFAGGYHAKSPISCYFLGVFLFGLMLLLQRVAVVYNLPFIATGIIAAIGIARIAPVESPNKPLEDIEVKIYGNSTKLIIQIEIVLALALYLMGQIVASMAIFIPMIMLWGVLLIGRYNNLTKKCRKV